MVKWSVAELAVIESCVKEGWKVGDVLRRHEEIDIFTYRSWNSVAAQVHKMKKKLGMKMREVRYWSKEEVKMLLVMWGNGERICDIRKVVRPDLSWYGVADKLYFGPIGNDYKITRELGRYEYKGTEATVVPMTRKDVLIRTVGKWKMLSKEDLEDVISKIV